MDPRDATIGSRALARAYFVQVAKTFSVALTGVAALLLVLRHRRKTRIAKRPTLHLSA